jgi:hypothetical protein
MSTLITDDVYEAVLAERVCAERSKDAASTLMGVPKTESGRNASAEASYPRLLLIIGILLAMSQCQRGGIVSATTIIEVLERAQAIKIPVPQYFLAEQADSTLKERREIHR